MADDEAVLGDRLADHGEVEVPLLEDRAGLRFLLRAQHHEHPLLALREHHLVGGHRLLAHRHPVEVETDAEAALVAHLDRRAGEARRPHVLDGDDRARRHQLEAGLHQPLLGEGVAHLHGGALLLGVGAEFRARHGRAAHAVAPGLGAEIDDRHADAARGRVEDLVRIGEAGGEGVDEAVAGIGPVEAQLARDRRHAEGVGVAADARHDAAQEPERARVVDRAEGERVHRRDRPRPHGEDVAQDAADAGRRALVGLDVGGVVVALHLEDHGLPVADVDDAGILARPLDHLGPLGRQGAEVDARRLVRAVLVPHRREDAELGEGRAAPQQVENAPVLVGLKPVRLRQCLGDFRLARRRDLGHSIASLGSATPYRATRWRKRPVAAATAVRREGRGAEQAPARVPAALEAVASLASRCGRSDSHAGSVGMRVGMRVNATSAAARRAGRGICRQEKADHHRDEKKAEHEARPKSNREVEAGDKNASPASRPNIDPRVQIDKRSCLIAVHSRIPAGA
jgi:hypothetical protein